MIGTREAARLLGIRPTTLTRAIWDRRLPAPERAPGGAYVWSDDDLRRAARVMLDKSLEEVLTEREGDR